MNFWNFWNFAACCLLLCTIVFALPSQGQVVTGKVTNEQSEPVPYATIFVAEAKTGTITNDEGHFKIQLPRGEYHVTIRSLGYVQQIKTVHIGSDSLQLNVVLQPQEFQIKEVKVFPGQEDPAYFIMRKAIAKAPYFRQKIKHYEAELYIKSNFAFTNIPKLYQNKVEVNGKKLKEVMKENVTYVIESQNHITYNYPNKYEQKVISKKTSLVGFDEPPVMELMTTSFYEERPNDIVSPLSPLALRHYNFRYEGFITLGNSDVFKIKVTPKRKSDELIDGYIYIVDGLWCIYNLDFESSFEFFDYQIKQQFEDLGNNNWLPISHTINGNFSALGLKGQFYYGASLKYGTVEDAGDEQVDSQLSENIAVQQKPKSEKEIEWRKEVQQIISQDELSNADVKKAARLNRKILKEQYQDSVLVAPSRTDYKIDESSDTLAPVAIKWDTLRAIPLTPAEIKSYAMADSLVATGKAEVDSVTGEISISEKKLISKILGGDYDLAKDSLFRLGYDGLFSPENIDFNAVDGYKYRQRMELVFELDSGKQISLAPQIGYAFNRKAFYGSFAGKFKNILWENSLLSVGAGKESRDFKPSTLGIQPALNAVSTWFFAENYMKLYETAFMEVAYSKRLGNGLWAKIGANYNHFKPLENNADYLLSDSKTFSPNVPQGFKTNSPELAEQRSFDYLFSLNYKKWQPKPWLAESPFLFMNDFYEFEIGFKQGLKNVFSSVSDFSHIDFKFHQQANISPSAGIDWHFSAGHFFSNRQMHFSQFKHFQTAEIPVSFNQFTNTFQLLNDYEFSTNKSYLNIGVEYRTEYILLRYLSFINQKTWSESLHFNYLTTPDLKNYWEAGYSLNSLFFVGNIGVFTGFKGNKFESAMVKVSISVFD